MDNKEQQFQERIKEFTETQDMLIDNPCEYLSSMRKIFQLMSDILEYKISQQENGN